MLYSDAAREALEREECDLTYRLEDVRQRLAEHRRYHESPGPDMEAYTRERLAAIERRQEGKRRYEQQLKQQAEGRYAAKEQAGIVPTRGAT